MHAKNKTNSSPQKSQHRDYGEIIDCAELQQVIVEVLLVLFSYCWMSKAAPKPLVQEPQRSSFGLYPELIVNGT